jgi:hypothetical protein
MDTGVDVQASKVCSCGRQAPVVDPVNHPAHYGGDTTYEVIKVLEAWGLDQSFCLGNTVKYIARAGKKDDTSLKQDLEKARWYLSREIDKLGDPKRRR